MEIEKQRNRKILCYHSSNFLGVESGKMSLELVVEYEVHWFGHERPQIQFHCLGEKEGINQQSQICPFATILLAFHEIKENDQIFFQMY